VGAVKRHDSTRRVWLWAGAIVAGAIALTAVWRFTPVSDLLTREHVAAFAKTVRGTPWSAALLIAAYVPAGFVMFPRQLLTILAALAFGPWIGFGCAMAGTLLASLAAYGVGRFVPRSKLRALTPARLKNVQAQMRRHGVLAVLALRVLPSLPFTVESVACGALRINVVEYTLGTALGMAPGTLALTVFGHQLGAAIRPGTHLNYWIVAGVVVVFAAITLGLRAWLRSESAG